LFEIETDTLVRLHYISSLQVYIARSCMLVLVFRQFTALSMHVSSQSSWTFVDNTILKMGTINIQN